MASVTLVHHTHRLPIKYEYQYDGMIIAYDGAVTIPQENMHWARPLFIRGYTHTPDGRWLKTQMDLEAEVARQLAETNYSDEDPQGLFPRKPIQTTQRVRAGSEAVPATV